MGSMEKGGGTFLDIEEHESSSKEGDVGEGSHSVTEEMVKGVRANDMRHTRETDIHDSRGKIMIHSPL